MAAGLAAMVALAGCSGEVDAVDHAPGTAQAAASINPVLAGDVRSIVTAAMDKHQLQAVIVRVTVDGKDVITKAFGESMPGTPATTDMHFRNGAVAISYVATALLQLVDEGVVGLDDTLSTWLPEVPHSEKVTLGQLAQMTSGYTDYVHDDGFIDAIYNDPFRSWTPEELYAIGASKPLAYEPGSNWNYSHTNYVLLGLALEKISGEPLGDLLERKVLGPLGLSETAGQHTPAIPEPALHAYTSERREPLGIPAGQPFLEESSYWNPSWSLARGAIQTSTITDLATTADAIGSGALLSEASHAKQVEPNLRGKTSLVEGCSTCMVQGENYSYGLGVVISGNWLLQNPMFGGYSAVEGSLPSQKIAVAVAVTYSEGSFDAWGDVPNMALELFRSIGAAAAPGDAPPQ